MGTRDDHEDDSPLLSITVPEGTEAFLPLEALQENAHGASNDLKATLRATGQRDPILVQRLPDGTYRIRCGNCRVAAARSLLWTDIRALIYDDLGEDAWVLIVAGVHERSENPVEKPGSTSSCSGPSPSRASPRTRAFSSKSSVPD